MTKFSFLLIAFVFFVSAASAQDKYQDELLADLTYLASDDLKGRANFSPEIDVAADYIQNRFKEIGLKPFRGEKSFLQAVPVYKYAVTEANLKLNNTVIDGVNLAVVSTADGDSSFNLDMLSVTHVGPGQELKTELRQLNMLGGNHLVLIDKSHVKWFNIYRNYFSRGLTKKSLSERGTFFLVLTDLTSVKSAVADAEVKLEIKELFNVVGVLPGQELKDEYVLYSSHYDHLGMMPEDQSSSADKDRIFNGADDNASGTSAVINLAAQFAAQNKNKRTLIFSAFSGEEIGGFGSKFFSKQLDPAKIIAMVNIEMIGKPSKFGPGITWITGPKRSNFMTLINNYLEPEGIKVHADPYPDQRLFYRSDNASLAKFGVPAHSFSTTQLDKDIHYHQVTDDVSTLNLESMNNVVNTIKLFSEGINDGTITPSRIEPMPEQASGKIY
ncbi:M20/M25/M40 family metallo-hydrolase [Psychrosphaera sp. 1_MG-2023]|uniref:M20/M25/M40 family metallo-hydrolase n=1 Tax=Psychrosphaera sp. 1_MG-2023 TaxID=3062643 RepID=UPI0026E195D0|nr:M20/M25/M40 family metallo-hydrolase [Psychrosphaera sp. 1_MG-2023]MDO6719129.1 M20/M25/M40 family metallo-hydrolase [Psychrosphaera sp. 1_MG-2023]